MSKVRGPKSALLGAMQRSDAGLIDLLGADGVLQESERDAMAGAPMEHRWRRAAVATLSGGATEIMHGIIAKRHLSLPRTRMSD